MNYLLNLCRFPILSLFLSALVFGALPAQAAPQTSAFTTAQNPQPENTPFNFLEPNRVTTAPVRLAQSVKVTPQLEKQILEVIRRNPDVLVEILQKYATEQQAKEKKVQAEAIAKVRKNTKAMIGDSPVSGASNRQIVMVAFSDFQCPYCASADKSIKQFMAKHKDKVTLVYKYFPLTQIHPEALPAARAAWAANKQGKFWDYHDALYANQAKLGEAFYLETATKLKLDLNKFNADRKLADDFIVQDFKLGRKLGVDGTPTFIMNGEVVTGAASISDLEKAFAQVSKK
jgi:protein-disulfide isomerase